MDIQEYFTKLNSESQSVFEETLFQKEKLGEMHHLSSFIYEFSSFVRDPQEKRILETVSAQLESSSYILIIGLYRQAFSSMRLALEMGLAAIYFSASKLEMHEWLDGRIDIKWSKLIDEENGVLSTRFIKAFFDEIIDEADTYRNDAKIVYRKLSEYVHGNNETWVHDGVKINYKNELFIKYCDHYKTVAETILFSAMCRYAKLLNNTELESLQFLLEEFNHIVKVRELFGRS